MMNDPSDPSPAVEVDRCVRLDLSATVLLYPGKAETQLLKLWNKFLMSVLDIPGAEIPSSSQYRRDGRDPY